MNILFLTQYFPPEVGAPQNRLYELATRLNKKGANISILTAMPNYPQMVKMDGYKRKFYVYENKNGFPIHRSYIFVKKSSSIFFRLLNYFSFVISSLITGLFKIHKPDYIFCESPPLFLGITAVVLCKIKKTKLIFNVSDLWPESAEKLGLVNNKFLLFISLKLEEFLYKKAALITCQTNGIVTNISSRFPRKRVYWLRNGVDIKLFSNSNTSTSWKDKNTFSKDDYLVFYGGILGYAQGLEVILYAAEILKEYLSIKFILMGAGPEKERLIKIKEELNLNNVYFFDTVPKNQMPKIISSIDLAVIPLKKIELFKGAIPSKIFEILAAKKPILLGVEGEAKDLFIDIGKSGLAFIPESSKDLADKILKLFNSPSLARICGVNGYSFVNENFNEDRIADDFNNLLNELHNL